MEELNSFLKAFVVVMIALALIAALGTTIFQARTLGGETNESVTFSGQADVNDTLTQDDVTSVSYFGNSSTDLTSSVGVGFNWTRGGVINIDNITISNEKSYNISYAFEPDAYVADNQSRTLLPLLVIFFAVVILMVVVGYFTKVMPKLK